VGVAVGVGAWVGVGLGAGVGVAVGVAVGVLVGNSRLGVIAQLGARASRASASNALMLRASARGVRLLTTGILTTMPR